MNLDWKLQELGIIQWKSRYKKNISGILTPKIPDYIRILLISEILPSYNNTLISDVIHSISLKSEQLFCLTPKIAMMLPKTSIFYSWWLGIKPMRSFNQISFSSPSLDSLQNNEKLKRALWCQIYGNKFYYNLSVSSFNKN